MAHYVDSEVSRLATVMLHRPGAELARLTPRNNDSLLFDGIPWVGRAQEEHDAFAEALRAHDVEVLYVDQLLAEDSEISLRAPGSPSASATGGGATPSAGGSQTISRTWTPKASPRR